MNGVKVELVDGVEIPKWLLEAEEVSVVEEMRRGIRFISLLIPNAKAVFFRNGNVGIMLHGEIDYREAFSKDEVLEIMEWVLRRIGQPQANRRKCFRCWTLTGVPAGDSNSSSPVYMECSACKAKWPARI